VKFLVRKFRARITSMTSRHAFAHALRRGNEQACRYLLEEFKIDINRNVSIEEQREGVSEDENEDSDDDELSAAPPLWFALHNQHMIGVQRGCRGYLGCHIRLFEVLVSHSKVKRVVPTSRSNSKSLQTYIEDLFHNELRCPQLKGITLDSERLNEDSFIESNSFLTAPIFRRLKELKTCLNILHVAGSFSTTDLTNAGVINALPAALYKEKK